jgi:hypothetical protein
MVQRTQWGTATTALDALFRGALVIASTYMLAVNWNLLAGWEIAGLILVVLYVFATLVARLNHLIAYRIVVDNEGVEIGGFLYRQFFAWDDVVELHVWRSSSPWARPCLSFRGKGHMPKGWYRGTPAFVYRSPNIFLFPTLMTVDPVSLTSLMKHAKRDWANSGENRRAALARRNPAS